MLGFLKYKIPLSSVCNEYLNQLESLMLTLDSRLQKANHPILDHYSNELAGFIFVLGRFVVQSSNLNEKEKQEFLVRLIDQLSEKIDHSKILTNMSHHRKDLIIVEFLNNRISLYKDSIQDADLDTQMFNLIHCFFTLSGLLSNGQVIDTSCSSFIMNNIDGLQTFLNTLKREYRLTSALA